MFHFNSRSGFQIKIRPYNDQSCKTNTCCMLFCYSLQCHAFFFISYFVINYTYFYLTAIFFTNLQCFIMYEKIVIHILEKKKIKMTQHTIIDVCLYKIK